MGMAQKEPHRAPSCEDHKDIPDRDKCMGKPKSCPVVPTVISGMLRARLSGGTSRDTRSVPGSFCSWKGRGHFPGGLVERNDELPVNLAGNFLLLVALEQSLRSASTGKAVGGWSQ